MDPPGADAKEEQCKGHGIVASSVFEDEFSLRAQGKTKYSVAKRLNLCMFARVRATRISKNVVCAHTRQTKHIICYTHRFEDMFGART